MAGALDMLRKQAEEERKARERAEKQGAGGGAPGTMGQGVRGTGSQSAPVRLPASPALSQNGGGALAALRAQANAELGTIGQGLRGTSPQSPGGRFPVRGAAGGGTLGEEMQRQITARLGKERLGDVTPTKMTGSIGGAGGTNQHPAAPGAEPESVEELEAALARDRQQYEAALDAVRGKGGLRATFDYSLTDGATDTALNIQRLGEAANRYKEDYAKYGKRLYSYGKRAEELEAEIREAERALEEVKRKKTSEQNALSLRDASAAGRYSKLEAEEKKLDADIIELTRQAAEAKAYYYRSVTMQGDFAKMSAAKSGSGDKLYNFINDIGGARETAHRDRIDEMSTRMNSVTGNAYAGTRDYHGKYTPYSYMTEEEIGVYNYLHAKEGREAAEKFLRELMETLNYRTGAEMYENMSGAGKAMYWLPQGLNQFASGIRQIFYENVLPTSPVQYAGGMVQRELAEIGAARDENGNVIYTDEGEIADKSLRGKLASGAYGLGTTISNMAPSILVSYVSGGVLGGLAEAGTISAGAASALSSAAGSLTLGASAGGNAYKQKLDEGWTRGQARTYATLVGASEASLQYLIGGIDKLGKGGALSERLLSKTLNQVAKIDNALVRASLTFGARMSAEGVMEGLEEGLQEVLAPAFETLITGKDYEVDFGDVTEAFLMGFLVSGVFNAPGELGEWRTTARAERAGTALITADMGDAIAIDPLTGEYDRFSRTYLSEDGVNYFEGCKSAAEVEARYRELAHEFHPDHGGDSAAMADINRQHDIQKAFHTGREKAAKLHLDPRAEQAMAAEGGNENAATEEGAERRKISMEDFANNESPMWNMLDGADTAAQRQITQDTFDQMVTEGKVVKVSGETAQNVEQYYPDLRNMKKKDRTPILKQKMNELKSSLRSFLNDMRGTSYEFEVNGSILEAKLYGVGVNEVIDAVTEQKAKMLYASAEIFRNAQYLYSLPDTDGDPNIYRWNYFLAPVEIGEDTVAVRVAVRDVAKGTDLRPESQIYNWNIKKDAALDGGSRGPKIASPGVSSATSDVANNISQKNSGVNTVYAEDGANIQRPRTLGEEMQRQMMQRGAADPSPYAGDPSAARQSRSAQDDSLTAESGGLRGLSLPMLDENTATEEGTAEERYSLRDKAVPTYEDLIAKPDMQVVDIRRERTGSFAQERSDFKNSEAARRMYAAPHLNRDTGERLFIVPNTVTHTFSNKGAEQIALMEHLPEVVEHAVLTHAEASRNAPDDHTTGVYTFFGAVRSEKGVQPVKLKVKEYRIEGQPLPSSVEAFFGNGLQKATYASVYDGKVLVLESIEKEEASSSALSRTEISAPDKYPSASSTISIRELLGLVNSEAARYVPKAADGGLRREQSPRPTAADGGGELRGLSLPTLNDNTTGGMRNGQAETGGTEPAEVGADPSSVAYGDTFPQGGRLAGTEPADAGAGGGTYARGAESTNDKRDGGRIGGGRTAGKAGGVDTRARAAIHGTPERYRARAEVQALAKDLAARGIVTPKSAAELGVQNGTDARTLTVIPEEYWDKTRYGDVLHELRDAGYEVIAVSGRIETEADGVRVASNGTWIRDMYGDETVIIQLDSPKADPYQIAAHERGHSLLARGEGMSRQVWEHLRQKNVQELDRLLERYIRGMRGIADVDGALTAEQRQMVEDAIMEEILCDALGGMERYGERAGAIRGVVREAMTELYGEGAVARENSEAVRRTGEATERHSIETLPNGDKYVRADRQVIFGNDPEVWCEQVENYINGKIRQGEDVQLVAADGDILKLTSDTAGKIASPYKDGRTLSEEIYQVKANAGVHIDELARISVGKENKKDAGARHGAFASGGWNYREAFFRDFDGKYYLIKFSVAKNNDGNIVYSIDDIDERAFPTAHDAHHGSSGVAGALGRESSADSITDTQQNVKSAPQTQQSAAARKPKQKSSYDFIRELTEETERQEQAAREERRRDGSHRSGADTEAAADYVSAMEEIYGELDEAAENLPSSLVNTKNAGNRQTLGERVREGWSYFKRKMVDSGEAVSRVAKATGDKSLYAYYNHARASSNAAIYMISDKQTNIRGEVVGKGLNEIFAPIRKDDAYYRDFQLYLLHKHNIDRMSLANPAATEMAREDFRMFKAEHPELENYAEYQIEEAARDEQSMIWLEAQEYVMLRDAMRRAERTVNKPVFGFEVDAERSRAAVKELLARNPEFAEMAEEVYKYRDNLMQYRVDAGLITQEDADYLNALYPHHVPVFRMGFDRAGGGIDENTVQIGKTLGRAVGGNQPIMPLHAAYAQQTLSVVREGSKNIFGNRLMDALREDTSGGGHVYDVQEGYGSFDPDTFDLDERQREAMLQNTFVIRRNGKRIALTVSPALYEGVKALSPSAEENNAVVKIMRASNDLFKRLCTGWNPTFLARNFLRDLQDAGLYSKDVARFAKNYPRAWHEIATNGEKWQLYKAMGGTFSSIFDYDAGSLKERKTWQKHTIDKIEALNMAIEQAPRFAEFLTVLEKGDGSLESIMDAMLAAADVTVNFGRSGTWGKWLNANLIPFLNPGIQGFDKMIRNVTETRGARAWAGLVIKSAALGIAPSVLGALLYGDDEEWQQIRDRDKDIYYLLKIAPGKWLKLPKGRTLSVLGGAYTRIAAALKGEKVDWGGFLETAASQTAPANPLEENILRAWFDADLMNKESRGRTWYGTDIESERLQGYAPGERYDTRTDEFSKWLGGALGLSPKKINYLLQQYTGVAGDILLPLMTPAGGKDIFTAAFTLDSVGSNKLSGEFYDTRDKLTYAKNSSAATGADAVMMRFWNKQAQLVSEHNAQIREIEGDDALSHREKAEQVRAVQALRNATMKSALDTLEVYREAAEQFYGDSAGMEESERIDWAYMMANREIFGAEYALAVRDKKEYAKAQAMNEDGMSYDDYFELYTTFDRLEPEDGKKTVTKMQKYRAIAGMRISDREKIAAIGTIMGTEMETESGGKSEFAKMMELMDAGVELGDYLDLKDADAVDLCIKYRTAAQGRDYGLTPELLIAFKELLPQYDANGNGSFSQEEVRLAIDALDRGDKSVPQGLSLPTLGGGRLTSSQKAVLWQMYNKSWKAKNNPYDRTVGQQIYDGLHSEDDGAKLPPLGGGTTQSGKLPPLQGLSLPKLN